MTLLWCFFQFRTLSVGLFNGFTNNFEQVLIADIRAKQCADFVQSQKKDIYTASNKGPTYIAFATCD